MFEIVGAVLAGGRSSRMGADKATVQLKDGSMAEIVARVMGSQFSRVVAVGSDRPIAGLDPLPDLGIPHQGPLAGLVAVLERFEIATVVVAVDQPLLRRETVAALAELAADGMTAVCVDGVPQVTCAAYQPEILGPARRHLEGGGSIRTLLAEVDHAAMSSAVWSAWGEDGRSWFSMDTRDDIVEAERRYRVDLLG